MATVGLAGCFGVLGLVFAADASLFLLGLPILVVGLATFLPLSTLGNLIAGWIAAGFLVGFVVTVDGVGPYFVVPTLTMLAAVISISPFSSIAEQLGSRWRSRIRNPDERLGLDAEQNSR